MSEEISLRELARRLGVANNSVTKAFRNCRIVRLANGKFLWPEVKEDWENNRDLTKVRGDAQIAAISANNNYAEMFFKARAKNEFLKAKKAEIELAVKNGTLIDKDYACKKAFNYSRQIRDIIMNSPARFAPEMAARLRVDEFQLTQEIDKYIRQTLIEVSQMVINVDNTSSEEPILSHKE